LSLAHFVFVIESNLQRNLASRGYVDGTNTPGPSNPKMSSKNEQGTKRKRSSASFTKLKDIEMARKKAALRRHLDKKREWSYVFVGNVSFSPLSPHSFLTYGVDPTSRQ
jgi:hypothetical protein